MPRVRALLLACHPEPAFAVTAVVTALAIAAGRGASSVLVALALGAGQLSVGWSNDWIDADRDRLSGRQDKPVSRGEVSPAALRTAALAAAVACVPLSLLMGTRAGLAHLAAVAAAWAYNAGLKATSVSFAPYALAFGLVPSIVTLGRDGSPWAPAWATAAGALLGVGAHFANVLPDLEDDLAHGIRGLPHRLGRTGAGSVAALLLLAATAVLTLGPGQPAGYRLVALAAAAVLTAVGLARGRRPGSRAAFRAVLLVAALDVALLLASGSSLR